MKKLYMAVLLLFSSSSLFTCFQDPKHRFANTIDRLAKRILNSEFNEQKNGAVLRLKEHKIIFSAIHNEQVVQASYNFLGENPGTVHYTSTSPEGVRKEVFRAAVFSSLYPRLERKFNQALQQGLPTAPNQQ